jgi:hypothetical protein
MDVCPWPPYVVLSCAGTGLATSWSLMQGVQPYVVKPDYETELKKSGPTRAVEPLTMMKNIAYFIVW